MKNTTDQASVWVVASRTPSTKPTPVSSRPMPESA
jgi:hypothetical protein